MTPHLVNEAGHGGLTCLFAFGLPAADAQESENVHLVNLPHAPAAFQKGIVGGIDEIRQRQNRGISSDSGVASVLAALVGNSSRICVVCVCTAMSASAMSCICWISAPSQRDRSDVKFHQGICIFFADGKVRQCITELAEPWHGFPVPEFENPIPVQIGNTSQHVIWHQFKKTALDYPRFMQKPIHLLKCFTELYRRRALYCRKAPFSEYCKHVSFTVHCKATLSFLCTACIQYYNKIIQITQSRQKIRRAEL